jgi:hypothetical protein
MRCSGWRTTEESLFGDEAGGFLSSGQLLLVLVRRTQERLFYSRKTPSTTCRPVISTFQRKAVLATDAEAGFRKISLKCVASPSQRIMRSVHV